MAGESRPDARWATDSLWQQVLAVLESAKWLSPVRSLFSGPVLAVNEA